MSEDELLKAVGTGLAWPTLEGFRREGVRNEFIRHIRSLTTDEIQKIDFELTTKMDALKWDIDAHPATEQEMDRFLNWMIGITLSTCAGGMLLSDSLQGAISLSETMRWATYVALVTGIGMLLQAAYESSQSFDLTDEERDRLAALYQTLTHVHVIQNIAEHELRRRRPELGPGDLE